MVRIIAGSAKGRTLKVPDESKTRPTSDRVKEAVFATLASWLGTAGGRPEEQLAGIRFADLYAGSGSIALEASSRGASRVLALESNSAAARMIRDNAKSAGLCVDIVCAKVEQATKGTPSRPFDVLWLDAPYAKNVDAVLKQLVENGWVAADALVIVERGAGAEPDWPDVLRDRWMRQYGDTHVFFAQALGPLDEKE